MNGEAGPKAGLDTLHVHGSPSRFSQATPEARA